MLGFARMFVKFDISEALECELGLLNRIEGSVGSLRKQHNKLKHMLVAMPKLPDTETIANK